MATKASPRPKAAPARPKRLTAEARRRSILQAARRAFTETGDMNGTTIRHIAERGGISEGVIYRHFESKDQLFFEAVVDSEGPLDSEGQQEKLQALYKQLVSTLVEVLPLLGLVLFGDPKVAQRFYREHLTVAMDRLASAWGEVERRYGFETANPDISARAVVGIALVLALETRHRKDFDSARALELVSQGTMDGFFPHFEPSKTKG